MRDIMLPKAFLDGVDACHIFDHFVSYTSAQLWTSTVTDTGTVTVETTTPGGVLLLTPSDGSVADNDEAYVGLTNKIFTIQANKPLYFEALVKVAEAATNAANWIVGFASTSAANLLQDNGAGPPADYTGAVFFKVDGDTLWQCEVSKSTTQSTKRLTADSRLVQQDDVVAGSTLWQRLSIEINPKNSTLCDVTFAIDRKPVAVFKDFDYSSAAAMSPVLGVKNGSTTMDYLRCQFLGCGQVIDRA